MRRWHDRAISHVQIARNLFGSDRLPRSTEPSARRCMYHHTSNASRHVTQKRRHPAYMLCICAIHVLGLRHDDLCQHLVHDLMMRMQKRRAQHRRTQRLYNRRVAPFPHHA